MTKTRYSNSPYYSPNAIERMQAVMAPTPDIGPYLSILDGINLCRTDLDIREHNLVQEMRKDGTTWETIGTLFGITRQAAQQRFGS